MYWYILSIIYGIYNPSHWLSYFSRWLKPPTSVFSQFFIEDSLSVLAPKDRNATEKKNSLKSIPIDTVSSFVRCFNHRIGWWENLQESPIFDGKNPWVSCKFSLKPIQWFNISGIARPSGHSPDPEPWAQLAAESPTRRSLGEPPVAAGLRDLGGWEMGIFRPWLLEGTMNPISVDYGTPKMVPSVSQDISRWHF